MDIKFTPEKFGLDKSFRLTKYSTLRGWGCKIPQNILEKYLKGTDIYSKYTENGDNNNIGKQLITELFFYRIACFR